jgi:hypothetical protein
MYMHTIARLVMFKGGVCVPFVSANTSKVFILVVRLHHELTGVTGDKFVVKSEECRHVRLCGSSNENDFRVVGIYRFAIHGCPEKKGTAHTARHPNRYYTLQIWSLN